MIARKWELLGAILEAGYHTAEIRRVQVFATRQCRQQSGGGRGRCRWLPKAVMWSGCSLPSWEEPSSILNCHLRLSPVYLSPESRSIAVTLCLWQKQLNIAEETQCVYLLSGYQKIIHKNELLPSSSNLPGACAQETVPRDSSSCTFACKIYARFLTNQTCPICPQRNTKQRMFLFISSCFLVECLWDQAKVSHVSQLLEIIPKQHQMLHKSQA